jgi:hypothetical protein
VECEEKRIKDIQTASVATRTRSKSMSLSPASTRVSLPNHSGPLVLGLEIPSDVSNPQPSLGEPQTSPTVSSVGGRRQSTISISSLHRPGPLPLKLDLSSNALRFTAEEFSMMTTGPPSPVTLAPKSARLSATTDFPPDMMTAFEASSRPVDIDLSVGEPESSSNVNMTLDPAIGSSADKPIELDMEGMDIDMANMTALFGPSEDPISTTDTDGLFTPSTPTPNLRIKEEDHLGREILQAFEGNEDIFASLDGHGQSSNPNEPSISQNLNIPSNNTTAPSPGSILATFATSSSNPTDQHAGSMSNDTAGNAPFDLDSIDFSQIPGLFTNEPTDMNLAEMEALLTLGGGEDAKSGE